MSDRSELIPADLAPRITQLVIDDLRAAGWTVEPPLRFPPKITRIEWMNVPRLRVDEAPDPEIWEDLSTVSEIEAMRLSDDVP